MSEPTSSWKETSSPSTPPADPAERLWRLWRSGATPDVDAFLAGSGALTPAQKVAALRVDQRERWQQGERIPAEEYLRRHADVRGDAEAAVDLVFNEYLIRERLGEQPAAHEYLDRFPEHAGVLRPQFELHQALAGAAGHSTRVDDVVAGTEGVGTASMATPARDMTPPEQFGRYQILGLIGQGGMGAVYRALDTELDRVVALKVPRFAPAEGNGRFDRFAREARAAAALDHPNLCPVYDIGRIGDIPYFTMPFLTGEPLSALLQREQRLAKPAALQLMIKVARAVGAAHEAGIIHRDLKPANVMIREGGEPVVMDFGLARRAGPREARLTEPGVLLGTAGYMPPEQLCGDPDAGGPAADVYSLGVILFEALTGRLPFEGPVHEVVRQALSRSPEPPSRFRPGLDPRLDGICLTALASSPNARFPSVGALADALERCLSTEPEPTEPSPPAAAPGPRRASRKRLVLAAVGLVAVAAGVAGGKAFFSGRPAEVGRVADGEMSGPAEGDRSIVADAVRPGSRWEGTFRFHPKDHPRDVVLIVGERDGNRFTGEYATEGGKYRWKVDGTVVGDAIAWRFTRAIAEPMATGVVESATVRGKLLGDRMEVKFKDSDSSTAFELVRQ